MSVMRLGLTTALLASATLCVTARAQHADSVRVSAPVAPVARASRRVGAIEIDGSLDDSAWRAATPITGLRQYQPQEGAPASLPTEIWLLYDDEALYIGARMSEPQGARGVRAPLARRSRAAISCSLPTAATDRSIRSPRTSSLSCSIRTTITAMRRCSR